MTLLLWRVSYLALPVHLDKSKLHGFVMGHPSSIVSFSCCRIGSYSVFCWKSTRRSLVTARFSVMSTSFTDGINSDSFCEIWSGTGSYAMLKVSVMCISWPFLYTTFSWQFCKRMIIRWSLFEAVSSDFFSIASRGLWSVSTSVLLLI